MTRTLMPSDLFRLRLVSDAQISPDGSLVAYVLTELDRQADAYRSRIVAVDVESGRSWDLTDGRSRDDSPRWSPDGRRLAFRSDREGRHRLYVLDLDSDGRPAAPARPVEGAPEGAGPVAWSPDGRRIAFSAPVLDEGLPPDHPWRGPAEEYAASARVYAEPFYRLDGEGFRGPKRRRVCVLEIDAPAGAAPRLTVIDGGRLPRPELAGPTGRGFDDADPIWSPDGRRLAFTRHYPPRRDTARWGTTEIWTAPADGGEPACAAALDGQCGHPAFTRDGGAILFFGHDGHAEGSTNEHLYRIIPGGAPEDLTPGFDRSIGNHVRSYERGTPPSLPPLLGPGDTVLFIATDGGEQPLWAAGAGGPSTPVRLGPGGRRVVPSFSVSADGRRAALVIETATSVGDVYVVELAAEGPATGEAAGAASVRVAGERRLTAVNDDLYAEVGLVEPERFTATGPGGWTVEGWILKPKGAAQGERRPLVLNIHGGPHGTWGYTLMFENQLLAAHGFAVVYGNPRGSQGYGEAFTRAVDYHWGEDDFRDLMALVDHACRLPFVDPKRLGVMGNSYGGFMTNWITSHDRRFRAAVTQGTISNLVSDFGTSDYGFVKGRLEGAKTPWTAAEALWNESPLKYVDQVEAATLILHGEFDQRCPIEQAEQWFAALQCRGVTSAFVRYPGESHGFTRTGKPSHRVDRLRRHLDWFLAYL
ncbi:MAG: S9 family peptidase [Firmicutes bacterium]|nr:S9 family peptidase [Bacillota bacterium]